MMKIYTKAGDSGMTGLFGGPRVSKDDLRICAYGSIDELNAVLGVLRSVQVPNRLDLMMAEIQHTLFSIGAELATPEPESHGLKWSGQALVEKMEGWIDGLDDELPELKNFVLPGGSVPSAYLHLARTVCRRAEREVIRFSHSESISELSQIIVYLNRLSDLLFVAARWANQMEGVPDVPWQNGRCL